MLKLEELYEKAKVPADEALLDELLNKYFSIGYKEMIDQRLKLQDLLYNKINIVSMFSNVGKNIEDEKNLMRIINADYQAAGMLFKPEEHDGRTNPLTGMAGWHLYKSWYLLGTKKIQSSDFAHRFYFGVEFDKLYEFVTILYEKLKAAQIPFYFKTTDLNKTGTATRRDNVVLYTSTALLEKTMSVIGSIEKERPDLIEKCSQPSILMGNIGGHIGYATEDQNTTTSYTDLVCETFASTLEDCVNNFVRTTKSSPIRDAYESKIKQYMIGRTTPLPQAVKMRILLDILVTYNPNFKKEMLNDFRTKLEQKGIDLENICFNKHVKNELENHITLSKSIDIFDSKVLNQVVSLPNGKKLTIQEYFDLFGVLTIIPLDAEVTINKFGTTVSGRDFIAGAIKKIPYFNSFEEILQYFKVEVKINEGKIEKSKTTTNPESGEALKQQSEEDYQRLQERLRQEQLEEMMRNASYQTMIEEEKKKGSAQAEPDEETKRDYSAERKQIEEMMDGTYVSPQSGIEETRDNGIGMGR